MAIAPSSAARSFGLLAIGILIGYLSFSLVNSRFGWNTTAQLTTISYCCNPNENSTQPPSCTSITTGSSCPGGAYTSGVDCSQKCVKQTYCCKNGNTATAVCNAASLHANTLQDNCDGTGTYNDVSSCFHFCGTTTVGNVSSSAVSSSVNSGDTSPYCCNPADASHTQPFCTPAA